MARSQGRRSSSSSGTPARILATFAGLWKSSASANCTPSRSANASPTVVFPDPVTPITTTSAIPPMLSSTAADFPWRRGREQPHPRLDEPLEPLPVLGGVHDLPAGQVE